MYFHDITLIIVALIAATPGFLSWRQSKKNGVDGKETRELVNGHMHEFIATTKELSRKIGKEEGVEQEKGEQNERTKA